MLKIVRVVFFIYGFVRSLKTELSELPSFFVNVKDFATAAGGAGDQTYKTTPLVIVHQPGHDGFLLQLNCQIDVDLTKASVR